MITVFIVEDDPMLRHVNMQYISRVPGFQVCGEADDIEEAKHGIRSENPNIILMDIFLPSGSGVELLKWMRKEEISSDVIFVTAEKNIAAISDAFRYGAVDYLVKPFTFKRFASSLKTAGERYIKLNCSKEVEQEFIDEHICKYKSDEENPPGELEKGLNYNTYSRIFDYIKDNVGDTFTAEGIAEELGLARVTVRRYLEQMTKENKLILIQEYGKVGRPTHCYKYCEK